MSDNNGLCVSVKSFNALYNKEEIKRTLHALIEPGATFNIRILKACDNNEKKFPKTYNGFFNDIELCLKAIDNLRLKSALAFYVTLNPVNTILLGLADNDFSSSKGAGKENVVRRRWMLIDCDPERESGVASTTLEKEIAFTVICNTRTYLSSIGWPEPIIADSANGYHLLYPIDIPTESDLVEKCLTVLSIKFNIPGAKIDTAVHDPARITKLYGTLSQKGSDCKQLDRPHRMSKILDIPIRTPVKLELLERLANQYIKPSEPIPATIFNSSIKQTQIIQSPQKKNNPLNQKKNISKVIEFFNKNIKDYVLPEPIQNGDDIEFKLATCPVCGHGSTSNPKITVFASGAISFYCFASGCPGHNWKAILDKFAPVKKNEKAPIIQLPLPCEGGVLTDEWWGRVFTKALDKDAFYRRDIDQWYMWNGKIYEEVDESVILDRNNSEIYKLMRQAIDGGCEFTTDACNAALSSSKMMAALNLVKNSTTLIDGNKFNSAKDLIAVNNGVIDLKTGELLPFSREHMFSKKIDIDYNPNEESNCPCWDAFIDYTFSTQNENSEWIPNKNLNNYIHILLGYFLTAETSDQSIYSWYGNGGNGKSVLVNTIMKIMGPYAVTVNSESFVETNFSSEARYGLTVLDGARFASMPEWPSHRAMNTALIKLCVGESLIRCRKLQGQFFNIQTMFKMVIQSNNLPSIKDADNGIWRRIKQIPFGRTVNQSQIDRYLEDKLWNEREGILAKMVKGAISFYNNQRRIDHHPTVLEATQDYRRESNPLLDILHERFEIDANQKYWKTSFKDIQEIIKEALPEGSPVWAASLSTTLASLGLQKIKARVPGSTSPIWRWIGIKVRGL